MWKAKQEADEEEKKRKEKRQKKEEKRRRTTRTNRRRRKKCVFIRQRQRRVKTDEERVRQTEKESGKDRPRQKNHDRHSVGTHRLHDTVRWNTAMTPKERGNELLVFIDSHKVLSHSWGAVRESRWPSWAVRPNEPSGFRGRKAILNHSSALVSACL